MSLITDLTHIESDDSHSAVVFVDYFCCTVQKLVASILLIAFMGQSFNQGWYYLEYMVRKKEYMKQCVNKTRPKMHCDGKCQLMKKIEERERQEQGQPPEMKYASKVEVLSSKSSFLLTFGISVTSKKSYSPATDSGSPVDQSSSIFHPPPVNS